MKRFPTSFALSGGNDPVDRITMSDLLLSALVECLGYGQKPIQAGCMLMAARPSRRIRLVSSETRGFPTQSHNWCGFILLLWEEGRSGVMIQTVSAEDTVTSEASKIGDS